MTTDDDTRDQQRESWDRFSGGWERWDSLVLSWLHPVADEMLRMLAVGVDAQHLDIATGTGEPGLSVAAIARDGRVVLADLASGMLDVAARAAHSRGLSNVEVHECSADALPFPDGHFDSISCRMGFMFFPDLSRSVSELRRVLRPGGKLCASVWAQPEGNPWATIPMKAIATESSIPAPPPGAPGLFRCSAPGAVSSIFRSGHLIDVVEVDVHADLCSDSVDEYWSFMTDVAAPVVAALSQMDDAARQRIEDIVVDTVRQFEAEGRVAVPSHARCILATK